MYDFFDRQEAARTSTRWLVFLFLLAVAAIVLAVYGAVVLALLWATGEGGPAIGEHGVLGILWRPEVFVWAAGGTLLLITVGSVWKTASLAKGGSAVASLLGGRPVAPSTTETDERRLVNVVEEMALAAGTPVNSCMASGLCRDSATKARHCSKASPSQRSATYCSSTSPSLTTTCANASRFRIVRLCSPARG